MNSRKITALYERLSRENTHSGDSDSIAHQKAYLEQVAAARGFENCRHYTDDGWSGGSFDRPGWNDMIADIEAGKVGAVLVKDMSRVGRDYLQTGFYTEVYFARKGVRFIAVDSHVDNQAGDSNEFAPLLNVLNEMYLHDQSRKVSIGFRAKGMAGKPLMVTPCFGYVPDPEDKNRWIIEPHAAQTVRRIFALAAEGTNPNRIAVILRDEQRISPGVYFAQLGVGNRCGGRAADGDLYHWRRETVVKILQMPEYLGKTVNFKTSKASYKAKRTLTSEEDRMVFENTHEPLIVQETWDKAQAMLAQRKRDKRQSVCSPFREMVICARCGKPMYHIHSSRTTKAGTVCGSDCFVCSTHHNTLTMSKSLCIQNSLSGRTLRSLLREIIGSVSRYALEHEADFTERLQRQLQLGQPDQMKKLKRSIMVKTNRIAEIDRLLRKLYEDYVLGRIPETRYDALSAEYEREQAAVEAALAGEKRMADARRTGSERIEQFMALAAKYRDCTEYSDEVLRQFVEKVVVHETQRDADGERSREIEVYLSFIGKFSVPAEPVRLSPAEQKHQEALKKRRIHARNKRAQKRKERMNMK